MREPNSQENIEALSLPRPLQYPNLYAQRQLPYLCLISSNLATRTLAFESRVGFLSFLSRDLDPPVWPSVVINASRGAFHQAPNAAALLSSTPS